MPSTSAKQHRLMEAVAHGWHKPGGGGPSPAVAKEFAAADKGRSFANGGIMATNDPRPIQPAPGVGPGAPLPAQGTLQKPFNPRDFLPGGVQASANGGMIQGSNKGFRGQHASFAAGGPVLGKTSQFLKTPDRFSKGMASPSNVPLADNKTDESWGKGSSKANPKGADKSEKPVLPRK